MKVTYENSKTCAAYRELVENPDKRDSIKTFSKMFDKNIAGAAIKLHKKISIADSAHVYNLTVAGHNKIELKSGVSNKDPLVLKVRIQDSYRKFFYFYENNLNEEVFLLTKNWSGKFNEIPKIHVYEVNKHDYSKA